MGDVLIAGITHYPPLSGSDEDMAGLLERALADSSVPSEVKNPATWPALMRGEWADDRGLAAAADHRAALVEGLRTVRAAVDEFDPDVVVLWGDDQYENFQADLIPPFAVLAFEDLDVQPWLDARESSVMTGKRNVWGEGASTSRRIRGAPRVGRWVAGQVIERSIDMAYAYRPLHHPGLAHAFLNSVLYLDYDRTGWTYPTLAIAINCYGRRVVSAKGFITRLDARLDLDPPGPSPTRVMAMGAAVAQAFADSQHRVALIASSSWSHAFLCDKTFRLRPDTRADRNLYDAMRTDSLAPWHSLTTEQIEDSGQQEMLNWCAAVGAVEAIGARLRWSTFIETDVFNSNKVFAIWDAL